LTQGDYQQKKVYHTDPLEMAKRFEDAGLQRLHVVDLDGAKAKEIINYKTLERICSQTSLIVDFGGGLKSDQDVKVAFESGAYQITGGTVAIKNPELFLGWLDTYGAERIILGADVKEGNIAISGWQEKSEVGLFDFLQNYAVQGIQYVICTDISKDGLLQGSAIELYQSILKKFPQIKLIASGGVRNLEELKALQKINCYGAIIGKAIYEGHIQLPDLTLIS